MSVERRLDRLEGAMRVVLQDTDPLEAKGLARVEYLKRQKQREATMHAIKTSSALRERLAGGPMTTAQMLELGLYLGAVVLLSRRQITCEEGVWRLLPVQEPISDSIVQKFQRLAVRA